MPREVSQTPSLSVKRKKVILPVQNFVSYCDAAPSHTSTFFKYKLLHTEKPKWVKVIYAPNVKVPECLVKATLKPNWQGETHRPRQPLCQKLFRCLIATEAPKKAARCQAADINNVVVFPASLAFEWGRREQWVTNCENQFCIVELNAAQVRYKDVWGNKFGILMFNRFNGPFLILMP